MFEIKTEKTTHYLTEYQKLLSDFQPRRIENFDDPEYNRVLARCEIYFDRDSKDDDKNALSADEEIFYNLLCTLISEVDNRCK